MQEVEAPRDIRLKSESFGAPLAPSQLGPVAMDGHIVNPDVVSRRNNIRSLFEANHHAEYIRERNPGVVVLIPIHTDSRISTLQHTLKSVVDQGYMEKLNIVIADNGLSGNGREKIQEIARDLDLPQVSFADARPIDNSHKNPAYARNIGIRHIRELARIHPEFRTDGVLLLDSDAALLPGGIKELENTYRKHEGTVAVTAVNIPVPTLEGNTYATYLRGTTAKGEEKLLPKLYTNGNVNVESIVAFGSDVAIKTCGVFIDSQTVNSLKQPFVRMPHDSAEDMLISAALSSIGNIYHNPNAKVLDQTRTTLLQIRHQRRDWGQDHAVLYGDLVAMRLVPPGLKVIEPKDDYWVEWRVPNSEGITGLMINPNQLKKLAPELLSVLEKEGDEAFGPIAERHKIEQGIALLTKITRHIDSMRKHVPALVRSDLPIPKEPNSRETRFSPEALTGLLAGNILGMHEIQKIEPGVVPQTIFFGVRQAGAWS